MANNTMHHVVIGSNTYEIVDEQGRANVATNTQDITQLKEDYDDIDDRVTALEGGGSGSGLTEDIKAAMLQIAQKVAYIDEHGQDYYDDLYDALYPPADLVSISCVYTQSGTVYDTDNLDSLKSDLVVTAHMSDSSTRTVTTYTLSGTLTEGTSTVTVSFGGKTTTFNVIVTHKGVSGDDEWYDGVAYEDLTIVANEYVKSNNGQFVSYDGWSRTGFVYCEGASSITFPPLPDYTAGPGTGSSNAWYTAKDTSTRISNIVLSKVAETTVSVPSNAKYFAISSATEGLESCISTGVVPHA